MKYTQKLLATTTAMAAAAFLFGPTQANATQTVRELFDKIGNADYITINGLADGATSLGLQGSWAVSPWGGMVDTGTGLVTNIAPSTSIVYKDSWSLDWPLQALNGGLVLTHSGGQNGLLNFNPGGNLNTIVDTNTGAAYGNFTSKSYATRPLAPGGQINFQANGTYYFSVRLVKSYSWSVGDNSAGVGFSTGGGDNDHFVGIGVARPSCLLEDYVTDIGNAPYVTAGTLGQPGLSSQPEDTGGPYLPLAYGQAGFWMTGPGAVDWAQGGLLVGRLTTATSGASTLDVKAYLPNCPVYTNGVLYTGTNNFGVPVTLEPDINNITWDASYNFTETNVMTHLLVFMHGTGALEYDAIRAGTTYADVVGLELIGAPKGDPANTVYAGTTVTISQLAGVSSDAIPMSFQWRSNGVEIVNATNATLVLTNPTTDLTADYSVVVSNYFGTLTSPETRITINPAVPPYFTLQPATPIARYAGGNVSFTVGVDGAPPFDLILTHAGTNVPGATAHLVAPGTATLTVGPLTVADFASTYSVTVTNAFGATNSQNVALTLITPPAGSFEAAALAHGAAAFWRLSDTTNGLTSAGVPLKEYVQGWNGLVPNEGSWPSYTNVSFGLPGPGSLLPGFAGITAISAPKQGGVNAQMNLPTVAYSNRMTMVCWTKISGLGSDGIMFDRNKDSGSSYFGINNFNGSLGSQWGDAGSQWNSGITLPVNQWVMLALVVETNETTLYAGIDPFTLQSVTRSSIEGVNYDNVSTNLPNGRLALGRSDYGWAVNNNAWGYVTAQFCDAAIFYQPLTPSAITNLFVAGFGTGARISGQPDGAGNLNLDWYPNAGLYLQEADSVTGPYTDNVDSPTPPYTVTNVVTGSKFYRLIKY